MKLSEYDFEVLHRPGRTNGNADALSRIQIVKIGASPGEILQNQAEEADLKIIKKTLDTYEKDEDEFIYFVDTKGRRRLIVPQDNRKAVMQAQHDTPFGGHQGIERTTELIKERYYWKGMDQDIEEYVKTCEKCIRKKTTREESAPVPMQITTPVIRPFQKVAMDIVGPLLNTQCGNQYILTFQDHFSNYPEAFAVTNQKAETTARIFVEEIICRHGTPEKLLTDQGTNFVSEILNETCKLLGIEKSETTPYHPQSNGVI